MLRWSNTGRPLAPFSLSARLYFALSLAVRFCRIPSGWQACRIRGRWAGGPDDKSQNEFGIGGWPGIKNPEPFNSFDGTRKFPPTPNLKQNGGGPRSAV